MKNCFSSKEQSTTHNTAKDSR